MAGLLKITNNKYTPIEGEGKEFYTKMSAMMKKDGVTSVPLPIKTGYRRNGTMLQLIIGAYRFNAEANKQLYLEAIYEENLSVAELDAISNTTLESSVKFLVDFSQRAWDEMAKAYSSHITNTVFQNTQFAPFDTWGANQTIRKLKKLPSV